MILQELSTKNVLILLFKMEKICVNKLSCRSAVRAGLTKQFTNSSRNGLLIRASKLQVNLQVHLSVHINVLCLTVILTVVLH